MIRTSQLIAPDRRLVAPTKLKLVVAALAFAAFCGCGTDPVSGEPGGTNGGADAQGADLNGVDLTGVDVNGVDLNGVDLNGVDAQGGGADGPDGQSGPDGQNGTDDGQAGTDGDTSGGTDDVFVGGDGDDAAAGTDDIFIGADSDDSLIGATDGVNGGGDADDACNGCTDGANNAGDGDDTLVGGTDGMNSNDDSDACNGCTDGVNNSDDAAVSDGSDGGNGSGDGAISDSNGLDGIADGGNNSDGGSNGDGANNDVASIGCKTDVDCSGMVAGMCHKAICGNDAKCAIVPLADGVACDDSNLCTAPDLCKAGACTAVAKICDDKNGCTDDSCDAKTGNCAYVPNAAACSDGNACTDGDKCAAGSCAGKPTKCDDGNICTNDFCDALKGCIVVNNTVSCDDGKCAVGNVCKDSVCGGGKLVVCDDGNPCTTDKCIALTGLCNSIADVVAACDDKNPCTDKDACSNGQCTGAPIVCDDKNPCTADSCDAIKGCITAPTAEGASCGAGDKCSGGLTCQTGKCAGIAKVVCDDANACTSDKCDPATGLCSFTADIVAACDDGDACTSGDVCSNGKCKGPNPTVCDDKNVCTVDSCDKVKGCSVANVADSTQCALGDKCVAPSTCQVGKCVDGAKTNCDDGNVCTDDTCNPAAGCNWAPNAAPCDDANKCTVGDVCGVIPGKGPGCKPGAAVDPVSFCDDKNVCTTDTCDAIKGCVNGGVADGVGCGGGDKCVAASTCQASTCTVGAKTNCDDGNPCTDDACDPATGCKWSPNSAPCDDGNKCTVGDVCAVVPGKGPSCKAGAAVDPVKDCDDKNACTVDTCDPAKGCVNTNAVNTPCDDANICTTGETCSGGKCQGGKLANCDDGNACTVDNCDPVTGNCSWNAAVGPCDDKNFCTINDTCKNAKCLGDPMICDDKNVCTADSCDAVAGKCVFKAVDGGPCDDSNACTNNDICGGGTCAGKQNLVCDDANVCTDDKCDPTTGKCVFTPNKAPCDDGNKCTTADICANTACVAGPLTLCDDANACTSDKCDVNTGKCVYTAVADNTPCDDKIACTPNSACITGICTPSANCSIFNDPIECGGLTKWTIDVPPSPNPNVQRKVIWAQDGLAVVADQSQHQCSLNFNNNTNYCDAIPNSNNLCLIPTGTATSPVLDFTQSIGLTPVLTFDAYYDVDTNPAGADQPKVTLRDATTKAVLATYLLPVTANDLKKWKNVYQIIMPLAAGKKVTIDVSLNQPPGTDASQGNTGAGFYVDNVKADAVFGPEVCTDGVDNNGNGKIDCADPACVGNPACIESICNDGIDNDGDGAIDCADGDCTANLVCSVPLMADDFACGDAQWKYQSLDGTNKFGFASDNTPAAPVGPAPKTGLCTLNFNDGVNYNYTQQNQAHQIAGAATWNATIDASLIKTSLQANFWFNSNVEGNANDGALFDRLWLQVSTDGFANCCGANQSCAYVQNDCNTANTKSYVLDKTVQQKWLLQTIDLKAHFGQKFSIRFKFDTIDNVSNAFPGVFVDDIRIYGK